MAGIGTEQIDADGILAAAAQADAYLAEDEVLRDARTRAAENGLTVPRSSFGATLRFLAALLDARSVVEVGTGTGVTGVWLLRGMRADGVLTSVDPDPDYQRMARTAYTEAGVPANRARLIVGRPIEVLPRLTDGGYDLMSVCADPLEYADYLREAPRLLRDGGVVVFGDATGSSPGAMRALGKELLVSEDFAAVLLPVGTGLLAATKRPLR
ncbi:O-methyltransferase [Sporichthya sp.]|uniref:O-methyltransferase n=1 Tax=Sporichthya sp. TaxID=65475 RepID=UPI00183C9D2C|nr:class I SAM-dependent methyltransferase [Sporichthya sp.]MBA3744859.1 class I SAM-dependent methyltransferase [Sporichthya sp.]